MRPLALIAVAMALAGCAGRTPTPEPRTAADENRCNADVFRYCANYESLSKRPLMTRDPDLIREHAMTVERARLGCERARYHCAITPGIINVERKQPCTK